MKHHDTLRSARFAVLVIVGFLLPVILGSSGEIYSAFVPIAIFSVMAYGLDIVVSDLGEVSLAHTVFFAVGAYTTALMSTGADVGPFYTFLGSNLAAAIIAIGLGLVTLRLRGFAFSLVTYAVAAVAATVAQNWAFLGGSDGVAGIPAFTVSLGSLIWSAKTDRDLWPVAYALLLATLWIVHAFRRSSLGHAAMMTHLNPRLATMSGIDPQRTRLRVLLFSAPITASAGWLYAYQRAYVSADVLDIYFLILMLTAVVLVGRRVLLGPLIGVALVTVQEKFLSIDAYTDKILLGGTLILILVVLPGGLKTGFDMARRCVPRLRLYMRLRK